MRVRACERACVRVGVRACACMFVCVLVRVFMFMCVRAARRLYSRDETAYARMPWAAAKGLRVAINQNNVLLISVTLHSL